MRFLPVTPERWPDLEALFGPRGAYSGCWCLWPRVPSREFDAASGAERKRAMRRVVERGPPPGLIAYEKGEPVAWVAVAPREATSRLARSRVAKSPDGKPAWAIACYFVREDHRGQGMMAKLTKAAEAYAKRHGAKLLEVFPVVDAKMQACDGFQGVASTLDACGFDAIARPTPKRVYMRKEL